MPPGSARRTLTHWARLIRRHEQLKSYREGTGRPYHLPLGPTVHVLNQAKFLQERGDLDGSLDLLKQGEHICRELGNKEGLSYSLGGQALILQGRGDFDDAMALHQEAERLYGEFGNLNGQAISLHNQATILKDRRNLDGALALYRDAERLCREIGNKDGLACSLTRQALIFKESGDLDRSAALHQEAQQVYHELGNREGLVTSLNSRAKIVQDRSDFDGSITLYKEAQRLYRELGNREEVAGALDNQVKILRERRDLDRTLELLALLLFAFLAEAQQLTFTPFSSTGVYRLGEKAGWTVSPAPGAAAPAAKYLYEIKSNNGYAIKSGTLSFAAGSATIEVMHTDPAMLYVTISAEGAPPSSAVRLGAAIAPTQLKPCVPGPADFDAFWDEKLRELDLVPINPVTAPVATSVADGVELSKVQVDGWGSCVHGYLAKPAKPRKFPALVMFQYAGVYALRLDIVVKRATAGWLAFGVVSHDLPPDQATGVSATYEAIGNANRETPYFLKMYLRAARAVDYVTSHPDWDGKTLVLMGTCMGGQQALVCAALRPQVTAVIADQPSGADANGDLHGRKAGYPYWPSHDPEVMATALYFDVVNFAPRIKAPVLASMGFIDTTSPPAGIWTVLNQLSGPKEVVTMIELDHTSRTPEKRGAFRSRREEVLDILLRGGQFRPNQ